MARGGYPIYEYASTTILFKSSRLMADLFTRLARRTLGLMPVVQPRIASRFAPEEAMASENTNIEIPSLFESDRSLAPRQQTAAALSLKESELSQREQEFITRTSRVEIESESPQKQELTSEESNSSQPRRETQEEERRNIQNQGIEPTNEPTNTVIQLGLREGNQELAGREKIGERSPAIELEGIQRVESDSTDVTEKEESLGEIVTKGGREVEKRREVEEITRESRGAITSEEVENKNEAKSLKVKELTSNEHRYSPIQQLSSSAQTATEIEQKTSSLNSPTHLIRETETEIINKQPSSTKSERSQHRQETVINSREAVNSGEAASEKVYSSTADKITPIDTPAPKNRQLKQLTSNEHRYSRTQQLSSSAQAAREMEQKASSLNSPTHLIRETETEIINKQPSSTDSERPQYREETVINSGEAASEKVYSSTADKITPIDTPAPKNRQLKQLEADEHRYSPTQQLSSSAQIAREMEQKASSLNSPTHLIRETETKISNKQPSSTDSERSQHSEETAMSSGEVASEKVYSSAADKITPIETPAPKNRQLKQLTSNEHRYSPTQQLSSSAQTATEIEQKTGSLNSPTHLIRETETKISNKQPSSTDSERSQHSEETAMSSGEVASEKVYSSAAQRITPIETPAPKNRQLKQLGADEHRYSPKQQLSSSAQTATEIEQKSSYRERESRGNESGSRESKESANPDKLSGKIPQRTVTAKIFSRNQEKSRESVREITSFDPVTEEKVDLRKVNSLEVDREIESESPLKSREVKEQDSKASAEELSTPNTSIALSRKAIAFETRGKVVSENQLTAPEFPSRESETSLPPREQEKPRALKGIEEREKLSSRREEQLSKLAPEIVNELTEKGVKKEKTAKEIQEREKSSSRREAKKQWEDRNSNRATEGIEEIITQQEGRSREDYRTGNNPLQLLGSKLAEERKASVTSTPTIQVTIGKIEVRGTKPAVKPVEQSRRRHSNVSSPKLSLDKYLKQRNR
ncbi:MAG: hypothetical protein F6K58_07520 [Symploca sp. SIO2E9]|nr:hypothetical protein [Symploca sp. SIO2E9]